MDLPDIVSFAEDHSGLGETRGADVGQHGRAAGALEAAVVPVAVQREQQVALHDLAAAAGAHLDLRPAAAPLPGVHVARGGAAHAPHAAVVVVVVIVVDVVVGVDVVVVVVEDVLGRGVGAGVRVVQPRVHPRVHAGVAVVRVVVHVRRRPAPAAVAQRPAAGRHARRVLVRRPLLLLVVAAVVRRRRVRRTQLRVRVEVRVHHSGQGCQFVQHLVRLSPETSKICILEHMSFYFQKLNFRGVRREQPAARS